MLPSRVKFYHEDKMESTSASARGLHIPWGTSSSKTGPIRTLSKAIRTWKPINSRNILRIWCSRPSLRTILSFSPRSIHFACTGFNGRDLPNSSLPPFVKTLRSWDGVGSDVIPLSRSTREMCCALSTDTTYSFSIFPDADTSFFAKTPDLLKTSKPVLWRSNLPAATNPLLSKKCW